jgi:hypothetical protein
MEIVELATTTANYNNTNSNTNSTTEAKVTNLVGIMKS